jgi:hypothetical protein
MMKSIPLTLLIVVCLIIWEFANSNPVAMSCDSCGSECARACGTRNFRTCCFNYVRKRSSGVHQFTWNKGHYGIPYEPYYAEKDNGMEQSTRNQIEKYFNQADNEVPDSKLHAFKPIKELSHLDGDGVVIDYEQQPQRKASLEGKQQYIYDA